VSSHWKASNTTTGNGIVEPCEVVVEPYYYYGYGFKRTMFNQHQDIGNLRAAMVSLEEEMTINGNLHAAHEDIDLDEPIAGLSTIFRLREGVERMFITDINNPAASSQGASQIVVMHDAISTEADHFNHVPGGANVLYLDGHVEFVKWTGNLYVGEFPLNLGGLTLHNVGEGIVPAPHG